MLRNRLFRGNIIEVTTGNAMSITFGFTSKLNKHDLGVYL